MPTLASSGGGQQVQSTVIRNALLKGGILFKTTQPESMKRWGSGIIDLGTPRLRTGWSVQFFSLTSPVPIIYEKEVGATAEAASFTIAIGVVVYVAQSVVSFQYSNTVTVPSGKPGPENNREAILVGGVNLPQTFGVPPGQQVTMQVFQQIVAAQGPEEAEVYEDLDSISVPKNYSLEIIMGYTQSGV
jgi:hypothetical protein